MRARAQRDALRAAARRGRAWAVVRAASGLLRGLGATRVVVFGSLAHNRWFSAASDIDLAAWGLDAETHLLALAALEDVSEGFNVDLVRAERCAGPLLTAIETEGVVM